MPGKRALSSIHTVKENQYHTPTLMVFSFGPFEPPSKKKNDTNDISFESHDIGLLESKTKIGILAVLGYEKTHGVPQIFLII